MEPIPKSFGENRSEPELINLSKTDIRNFEPLYERYYCQVFRYIYNKMELKDDAADLTSNVFLKAMAGIPTYKVSTTPFVSWLLVIAKNEVATFYRKRGSELRYFASQEGIENIARDSEYEASEGFFPIRKILELLPDKDFELIDLKYFNKKSVREISEITGITPNRIRVRLHRIRERIAKLIRKNGPDLIYYTIPLIVIIMHNILNIIS